MKTFVTYSFVKDDGAEVQALAGMEGVTVNHVIGSHWDGQKEVQSATQSMLLNSDDARELAANLLKAADHADEVEKNRPKQPTRGRY